MSTPQDRPGPGPDVEASEYADPAEIEDLEASASDQQDVAGGATSMFLKITMRD